jgi:hypothetical protein
MMRRAYFIAALVWLVGVSGVVTLTVASSCTPSPTDCITPSGVVLRGCEPLEGWTQDVARAFAESPCPEVRACDVLTVLRGSAEGGLPATLRWGEPPLSGGRHIQAASEAGFKHELTHALIDGCRLASWNQTAHHELMERCRIP